MKLPKLAIENYQFVLVIILLGISTGLLSFFTMPRSEDPSLKFPNYNVVAVYPGTSPVDIEELVVDPIEEVINEVEDITEISTEIEDGFAVIQIEAEFGIDIDDKYDEINAKVNEVRNQLPEALASLEVNQISPLDVIIMQLALSSSTLSDKEVPYHEMIDKAEKLEDILEKIDGVRTVEIEAYPEEEIRIALDFEKIAQLNIPLPLILGKLQANNANIPGGNIDAGTLSFSLKTSGGYRSISELQNTVISGQGDYVIYLKDIADVSMDYEDKTYIGRYNQAPSIFISVTQKEGFNILSITDGLRKEVDNYRNSLPAGIDLNYAFVQGPAVAKRLNEFFISLFQGIVLVGLLITLFLGIRNAIIIMTVIPTSILIAINLLDISGFGLQQISIAGLVIALGLLVDNGIVVIENITRYRNEGNSLLSSAVKGTSEVGWAIVSSTATTILAFFPITQLGGGTGEFVKSLPITVIFSLLASLVLALAFSPLLANKLMPKKKKEDSEKKGINAALQAIIEKGYRPILDFSLRKPLLIVFLALLSLGGSFALFPLVGVSFFPAADKPLLVIDVDLPQGTSLDRTDQATKYVEQVLDSISLVKDYSSNIGHGNPQIYYNVIPESFKKNHAQIIMNLKEWEEDSFYKLISDLRTTFEDYPGARITIGELKNGPPFEAPIAIKIIGDELDSLRHYAASLEEIYSQMEGVINIDNPLAINKTDLKARIKREKVGLAGMEVYDIDVALRTAMTGNEIGIMNTDDGEKYPMVVRLPFKERLDTRDFNRIYLTSNQGKQVPLSQLASLEFQPGPSQIDHFDLQRTTTVTADVQDGYNVTAITEQIISRLDEIKLSQGYDFYIAGEYETQQESFGALGQQLLLAILGILAVLILQFRSFSQPFIVLSAIPLAFSGSILALLFSGYSFSFFAFIGFTSLAGIVVNTSIILVDYSNQLIAQGYSTGEALRKSAETRFTPILLTTLTTISGLLPLTLTGGNLWAPLGWAIIGGMVSSTLLTLLIVPILYQWLTGNRKVNIASQNGELHEPY